MTETLTCYYENNDEPTCPACNHYNAMLADHEAPSGTERDYRKCRDCGAKAYVVAAPSRIYFMDELGETSQETGTEHPLVNAFKALKK